MKNSMTAVSIFFIVLALGSLVLGFNNYRQEQAIFARAEQVTAALTRWVPDPNPKTADFCPVYEYTTSNGQQGSYVDDRCLATPDDGLIGHQETVYIDPSNPHVVETSGMTGSEGSGLIVGTLGCGFFGFMAAMMYL